MALHITLVGMPTLICTQRHCDHFFWNFQSIGTIAKSAVCAAYNCKTNISRLLPKIERFLWWDSCCIACACHQKVDRIDEGRSPTFVTRNSHRLQSNVMVRQEYVGQVQK